MKKIFYSILFFILIHSTKSFSYFEIHNYCPIQFIIELHAADGVHYFGIMGVAPAYYIFEDIPVNSYSYAKIWPQDALPVMSVGTLASGFPGFDIYSTPIPPMTVPFGAIYASATMFSPDDIGILILATL